MSSIWGGQMMSFLKITLLSLEFRVYMTTTLILKKLANSYSYQYYNVDRDSERLLVLLVELINVKNDLGFFTTLVMNKNAQAEPRTKRNESSPSKLVILMSKLDELL